MSIFRIASCLLFFMLAGCGGGGGSSRQNSPVPPENPPVNGGGGGGSGGSSVVNGGLISGGVRVSLDSDAVGVVLDVAVGGTGMVAGDIQAFGSVIANGITTDTDAADFLIEGVSGTQNDLQQGQQILIVGDTAAGSASQVLYRSNVRGPVTALAVQDAALGQATFTVLGQNVVSDGATTYANVNIAAIALGDDLEVSGTVEENGDIVASFIERQAPLSEYKVTGQISNVTATAFALGGLTVDYSNAALRNFPDEVLNSADVVEVKALANGFTEPATLQVTDVERLPVLTVGGDAIVRVEGFIDRFASLEDFDVQTTPITVDADTEFENGEDSDLALGRKVQIEGMANGSGAVLAREITLQPTGTIRAEGNIESIDAVAQTVSVLGITFQIRALTELEDESSAEVEPFELVDLGIGDELEIRGYLDGSVVVATSLEREDPEDRARLRGLVSNINSAESSFDIQGVTISVQEGVTQFEDDDENILSQTEFFNLLNTNGFVSARWNVFSSTTVVADEVVIEDD
ncbi:MAG: DUF5666 domain-containing protein [bacterium]